MTLPSTYHSPRTVKKKARVLTMGTVKLSSAVCNISQRLKVLSSVMDGRMDGVRRLAAEGGGASKLGHDGLRRNRLATRQCCTLLG